MNGIEVLEHVRSYIEQRNSQLDNLWVNEPRIVFLTAFKTKQFTKHMKALGVTEVHDKPILTDQLKDFVDSSLAVPDENINQNTISSVTALVGK